MEGIAWQADGRIVVMDFAFFAGIHGFAVARYFTNGSLDPGFGDSGKVVTHPGSAARDGVNAMALPADGKIVGAGFSDRGNDLRFTVLRNASDGVLDTGFGNNGVRYIDSGEVGHHVARSVLLQRDGKIVVTGSGSVTGNRALGTKVNFRAGRLTADGNLDPSFRSGLPT